MSLKTGHNAVEVKTNIDLAFGEEMANTNKTMRVSEILTYELRILERTAMTS